MAKLVFKESIAPQGLWHWVIQFDSGHVWESSKQSFTSLDDALQDAVKNATEPLQKVRELEYVTNSS